MIINYNISVRRHCSCDDYYMHFSLYDLGTFSGFYYRELTKAHHFTGDTQLSIVHTHTLILGMFMFLILIPLEKVFKLSSYYLFNWFFIVYNISVIATIGMMVTKGTFQVLGKVFLQKHLLDLQVLVIQEC